MNRKILNKLELLPFFTKSVFLSFEKIGSNALNQDIKRWTNEGVIIRLKNGLYVTKTFVDRSLKEAGYVELLAGVMLAPSYLSLEYVLQKHNLLTEGTFTITSVSTKSSRRFVSSLGTFTYKTVSPKFYFGFEQKRFGKNIYYEAKVSKALFDLIYLRSAGIDPRDPSTIDELRINWNELAPEEFNELCRMADDCGIRKIKAICGTIKEKFYGNTNR